MGKTMKYLLTFIVMTITLAFITPANAFFNSFPGGYLTGICIGLNPACWVGKSIHDSNMQQQHEQERKAKEEKDKQNENSK